MPDCCSCPDPFSGLLRRLPADDLGSSFIEGNVLFAPRVVADPEAVIAVGAHSEMCEDVGSV
jgi:hypothetical protein